MRLLYKYRGPLKELWHNNYHFCLVRTEVRFLEGRRAIVHLLSGTSEFEVRRPQLKTWRGGIQMLYVEGFTEVPKAVYDGARTHRNPMVRAQLTNLCREMTLYLEDLKGGWST